jgi:hypothetical protein
MLCNIVVVIIASCSFLAARQQQQLQLSKLSARRQEVGA